MSVPAPSSTPAPAAAPPSFEFPREHNFPPFFTRQTNLTTLHSQQEKWSTLILSYCRHHRLFRLSLSYDGTPHEDLFRNRRLGRSLRLADAREVLDYMRREGRAEPVGSRDGDVFWVYWRTPEEWAALVEAWVEETAQKNTVLTLYELTEGEGTRGTGEFYVLRYPTRIVLSAAGRNLRESHSTLIQITQSSTVSTASSCRRRCRSSSSEARRRYSDKRTNKVLNSSES
ncbi:ESCRT-II complex subunit-domain-containing protein [Jackrogersella minutella]|nr:ESCRT-II complex subunit-domain-containing protein [Jackrogersella minutella]